MLDSRYQSQIPANATEVSISFHKNGVRAAAEYWLEGRVVGKRYWDPFGNLSGESPLKDGVLHGVEYSMDLSGNLELAEPYCEGKMHGTAYQWEEGSLIGTYTMVHGTGIDIWRGTRPDGSIWISEVRYFKDGERHGFEWWLDGDQQSVYEERHLQQGKLHGIERSWNFHKRLRRGYPRYFVNGQKVTKRQYLAACRADPTLPPFCMEDNNPARTFPPELQVGQDPSVSHSSRER